MRGKDKLKGNCSNFISWLRVFEHQAENVLGGCCNPPRRTCEIKNEKEITIRCTFSNCMFTKGRSFSYCAKTRFIPPPSYYVYNDVERIDFDFDFDIVTNVQVVECGLPPPPPNTHIP